MFKKTSLLAIMCALCLSFSLAKGQDGAAPPSSDAADKALQERIAKLVDQLGAEKFDEREAAEKELIEIGDDAYDAVRAATKSPDPEIALRARRVFQQIDDISLVLVCLDEKGNPIANKAIELDLEEPIRGATDEKGRFSTLLPHDVRAWMHMYTRVKIEGYPPLFVLGYFFQGGKHVARVKFLPGGTVKGTVVIKYKNEICPASKAKVEIDRLSTTADENGLFELKDVPAGPHTITFQALYNKESFHSFAELYVKPGETVSRTFFCNLIESYRFSGPAPIVRATLVDADGKPLANASGQACWLPNEISAPEMFWMNLSRGTEKRDFTCDGQGAFKVEIPTAGKIRVRLFIIGLQPVDLGEHEFKAGEVWEIKEPLKVEKGCSVEATVKDAKGKPLPAAHVIAQPVEYGVRKMEGMEGVDRDEDGRRRLIRTVWGAAQTKDSGVAVITGLPPAKTAFKAVCDGYVDSECKVVEVTEDNKSRVEFTLVERAHVTLTMEDADTKRPIRRAFDYIIREQDAEQEEIIVCKEITEPLNDLVPGKMTLAEDAEGYYPGCLTEEFKPGQIAERTLSLKKIGTGTLKGKIEPAEGAPLENVSCVLAFSLTSRFSYSGYPCMLRTADDGRFWMDDVQAGKILIGVRDIDGNLVGTEVVTIEEGKTANVSLKLKPPGSAEIALTGSASLGDTAAGLCLIPCDEINAIALNHMTGFSYFAESRPGEIDGDRTYRFNGVPAGEYCIGLYYSPRGQVVLRKLSARIEPGKTVSDKIDLTGSATVEGRVAAKIDYRGAPLYVIPDGADASMIKPFCAARHFAILGHGAFKIGPLPPGKYHISAAGGCADVEVADGKAVSGVQIRPAEKLQKFSGKIKDYSYGKYWCEYVYLVGNVVAHIPVRPDGTFNSKVPPGKYKMFHVDYAPRYIVHQMETEYFTERIIRGPSDVTIEDGKDLAGVELEEK